jgi:hypothetical protein
MPVNINQEAYLKHAKAFTAEEKKLLQFYRDWLPDNIIDCHTHCNLMSHVLSITKQAYNHMLSTFPGFSLEESATWNKILYPGKNVRTLRFPKVFKGICHKKANDYLLAQSPEYDRVAIFGLPEDIDYTIKKLSSPGVSALKMYYSYLKPVATEIYQFFPPDILKVAEEKSIPIVLHLPFQINKCIAQVHKLISDFPNLKICLAHIGDTYVLPPGLREILKSLKQFPQVTFDTAYVSSVDVLEIALRTVGINRILYGSDSPINLIRSTPYQHPTLGERFATNFPYHWANNPEQKEYGHLGANSILAHWRMINAIKVAISRFPQKEQNKLKHKIFFDNAKIFYGF